MLPTSPFLTFVYNTKTFATITRHKTHGMGRRNCPNIKTLCRLKTRTPFQSTPNIKMASKNVQYPT